MKNSAKYIPGQWTADRVKEELPSVRVKLIMSDRLVKGRVRGRKNRFASVIVKVGKEEKTLHYAWGSIANALNSGKHLWG